MSNKFKKTYRVSTVRATWWDYSSNGSYFITICTKNRIHYFGEIVEGEMILNKLGERVLECWKLIPSYYPFIELDAFVVMPNHVHGVLHFNKKEESQIDFNLIKKEAKTYSGSLGAIVRGFKVGVKKEANNLSLSFIWQSGYHEYIIRNGNTYQKIVEYIYKKSLVMGTR